MLFLVLILTAIKLAVSGLTLQILVADKAHLSMKGANTRYSHPQPLGWGTDVMTQDCVSLARDAEKLGENRTPSGCSSNVQFPGAPGAEVPAWCLMSSVLCPGPVPAEAAKPV